MGETWKEIPIKDKMQIINGTASVFAAIILYFVAFLITLCGSYQLVSAGATLLATGLAFFGITSYIKNQMIDFETKMGKRLDKIENDIDSGDTKSQS